MKLLHNQISITNKHSLVFISIIVVQLIQRTKGFSIRNPSDHNIHKLHNLQSTTSTSTTSTTTTTGANTNIILEPQHIVPHQRQHQIRQLPHQSQETDIMVGVTIENHRIEKNQQKQKQKQTQTQTQKQTKQNQMIQPSMDIKACWSKAGVGTCFVLEETEHKKFNVVFDLGCTPIFDQTMKVNHVVLSHVHMDHFGAIFGHARAHCMTTGGNITPTYYIPKEAVPKIQKAIELFSDIDATCKSDPISQSQKREKGLLKMKIVPIEAGVEVEIETKKSSCGKKKFYLRPFDVSHCGHPSLGYTLVSKTTKKSLKEEYIGLDRRELGRLAKSGAVLNTTDIVETIEACYSGDTNLDGLLLSNPHEEAGDESTICDHEDHDDITNSKNSRRYLEQGFTAPLIMCELTYLLESEKELAKERGHINVFDIEPILRSHNWGGGDKTEMKEEASNGSSFVPSSSKETKFIFYHLSSRGRHAENILESMATVLPKDVVERTEVALASFSCKSSPHLLKDNGCISVVDYMQFLHERQQKQKHILL